MISSFKPLSLMAIGCIALLLSSCNRGGEPDSNPTVLGDPVTDVANLENDILIAPAIPDLEVHLSRSTIEFIWQAQANVSQVNLYSFDTQSKTESLISDQVSLDASPYTLAVNPLTVPLDTTQYRLELCEPANCVSSYYQSPEKPVESTIIDNGKDESRSLPYFNHSGNLLVSLTPNEQTANVYFNNQAGWHHAGTFSPASLNVTQATIADAALSESGDTFAIATYQVLESKISISVFDRLGEAWFETSQWDEYLTGASLHLKKLIAISGDASKLTVLNAEGFATYRRDALTYQLESSLQVIDPIITWDTNATLSTRVWASSNSETNYTVHKQHNGEPVLDYSMRNVDAEIQAEHLTVQINDTGDEAILAGWQLDDSDNASLVFRQLSLGIASIDTITSTVVAERFSGPFEFDFISSNMLEVSTLYCDKQCDLHAHVYHASTDGLKLSFELQDYLTIDSPIHSMAISGDGSTLAWANGNIHTLQ